MKTNHVYPVLFLVAATLSACGGGGGGGGNTASSMPETQTPEAMSQTNVPEDTQPTPASTVEASTDLIDSNPAQSGGAIKEAATARPIFGSVTQSSNIDPSGVTTDQASGQFDGQVVEITVQQVDNSSFSFGNDSPAYFERNYPQAEIDTWAPSDYDSGNLSWHARIGDGDSTYHADYIGVVWNSGDTNEFLTWGYWLRSDDNPFEEGVAFEAGSFVDGPEIDEANPPTLPSSGTASYSGSATGIYHHQYGPGYGEFAGAIEIGQYVQPLSLEVDFSQAAISVCGACTGPNLVTGDLRASDGTYYSFSDVETAYRYEATATFNSDGTFRSQQVTLTNPDNPVTSFEGSIGGIFSNIPDANGDPRMVVGTSGGTYTNGDGSEGSYVGSFGARVDP